MIASDILKHQYQLYDVRSGFFLRLSQSRCAYLRTHTAYFPFAITLKGRHRYAKREGWKDNGDLTNISILVYYAAQRKTRIDYHLQVQYLYAARVDRKEEGLSMGVVAALSSTDSDPVGAFAACCVSVWREGTSKPGLCLQQQQQSSLTPPRDAYPIHNPTPLMARLDEPARRGPQTSFNPPLSVSIAIDGTPTSSRPRRCEWQLLVGMESN
ncbi:hypothetical protein M408DRAFT_7772 [Serendipita vermifera MAFF 305830]|uniref:Uncharacterized protein n=1 Tax=Serendipita vermifera MAFF 305830 TaxID=933852 RepID=A0A0C3BDR1_SERVB|nr:hypothetical protein M408DRAFT_7772 [Serendipita vermifera MAFF 305830]